MKIEWYADTDGTYLVWVRTEAVDDLLLVPVAVPEQRRRRVRVDRLRTGDR